MSLMNIGHRGAMNGKEFYENSMESFKMAAKMKLEGIETDIYMTKDEQLVLIHRNRDFNQVAFWNSTRGEEIVVSIHDYTLKELQEFDLLDKKQKIVTLQEFLEKFANSNLLLCLELKDYTPKVVQKTIEWI